MVLQYRQKNTARPTGDRTGRLSWSDVINPATNNAQETSRVNTYINITLILHRQHGACPRRAGHRPLVGQHNRGLNGPLSAESQLTELGCGCDERFWRRFGRRWCIAERTVWSDLIVFPYVGPQGQLAANMQMQCTEEETLIGVRADHHP